MLLRRSQLTSINNSHPAARNARWLAVPEGDNLRDIITHQVGANTGTNVAALDQFLGATVNTDAAASRIVFANRPTNVYSNVTWAALTRVTTNTSSTQYVCLDGTNGGSPVSGLRCNGTQFIFRLGSTSLVTLTPTGGCVNRTFFIAGSVCQGASGNKCSMVVLCIETGELLTGVGNFNSTFTGNGSLQIGDATNGRWPGHIGFVFQSQNYLPLSALIAWAYNPYSIFDQSDDLLSWSSLVSGGNIYNVTMSESGTAADTVNSQLAAACNDNESGTAADTVSSLGVFGATVAESGTAASTQSSSGVLGAALSEAGSASDTYSGAVIFASVVADGLSAAELVSSLAIYPSSIVESAPITDTQSAPPVGGSTIAEAMNATDTYSASVIFGGSVVEAASATNTQSLSAVLGGSIVEAGSAGDAYLAQAIFLSSFSDGLSAADHPACIAQFNAAIGDVLTATDAYLSDDVVRYATKCNTLQGAPRVRRLAGGPRIRTLGGRSCD